MKVEIYRNAFKKALKEKPVYYSLFVKPSHKLKFKFKKFNPSYILGEYDIIDTCITINKELLNYYGELKQDITDLDFNAFLSGIISHEFIHYLIHKEIGYVETVTFDNLYGTFNQEILRKKKDYIGAGF